ncbi:60S ribosomal protein L13a-4 [Gossypium raimondii]|uniref:60S ribosomal protein L13a-4 n=1 Tax=Gossypium raimondii TaxID=29730 RepID=UPI00227A6C0B|nr:60S ribosomal protein L13a-4 [Gossypium raimondii]
MCSKRVAVDARRHLLGRLASILAKELLNGQKVVVVRCEEICMWGGLVSQKMNLMRFLRKRMNTESSYGKWMLSTLLPEKENWIICLNALKVVFLCICKIVKGRP